METSLKDSIASAHAEAASLELEQPLHVAYMNKHFSGLEHSIVDATLTAGNCHGLTFGGGGATMIDISTVPQLLVRLGWDGDWINDKSADILVCFVGVSIGHTATKAGDVWRQTLPGGPLFTSTRAVLETKYDCFDLSTRAGREGVDKKHDEIDLIRKELIALCSKATGIEDMDEYYLPRWKADAIAGKLDVDQMQNYIGQIKDL